MGEGGGQMVNAINVRKQPLTPGRTERCEFHAILYRSR